MHNFHSRPLPGHPDQLHASASVAAVSPPPPPPPPTDDAIEALILQATSARAPPDGRPLRDTRTQLFVGNLPYRVRWQDLKDLFRKAGTVLRADVSLGPDNRSRGYGTVLLATAEDAGRAVDMFNGYSWQTRILEVRLDRLLPEYDPAQLQLSSSSSQNVGSSSGASTSTGSTSHPSMTPVSSVHGSMSSFGDEIEYMALYPPSDPSTSSRNLFVGNLPFHCQWQDLKDLFRQAGTILRADVALGSDNRSRGFGTVVFATDYDAERAMKMFNGYEYHGRVLKVHFDRFSQMVQPIASGSGAGSGTGAGVVSPSLASATTLMGPPTATLGSRLSQLSQQSLLSSSPLHSSSQPQYPLQQQQQSSHPQLHQSQLQQSQRQHQSQLQQLQQQHQQNLQNPQLRRQQALQPPGQLKLPPGFMYEYDYGSPSGPSSPYELFTQLQMQMQAQMREQERERERERESERERRGREAAAVVERERDRRRREALVDMEVFGERDAVERERDRDREREREVAERDERREMDLDLERLTRREPAFHAYTHPSSSPLQPQPRFQASLQQQLQQLQSAHSQSQSHSRSHSQQSQSHSQAQSPALAHQGLTAGLHQRLATSRSFPSSSKQTPAVSSSSSASLSSSLSPLSGASTQQLDRDMDALASTLAASALSMQPKYTTRMSASSSSSSSGLSAGARSRAPSAASGVGVGMSPKPPALSAASSGSTSYTSASASASASVGELRSSSVSSVSSQTSASLGGVDLGSSLGRRERGKGRADSVSSALEQERDEWAQERYGQGQVQAQAQAQAQAQSQGQRQGHIQTHGLRAQQRYLQYAQTQAQSQTQAHPHHPGPIAIPPPLSAGAFQLPMAVGVAVSPHTPHAASPLHHPTMGSPYHFYPAYAAGGYAYQAQMQYQQQHQHQQSQQQQQQQGVQTPHGVGLTPFTPSMPPFTFLTPLAQTMGRQRQQQHQQHQQQDARRRRAAGSGSGSASASSSASVSSGGSVVPASQRAKDVVTEYPSLNAAASSLADKQEASEAGDAATSARSSHGTSQQHAHSTAAAPFRHHAMNMPLPSPGHVYSAYPAFPSPPAFGVHPAFITSSGLPSPHGLYPVYQTPQQSHTQQQQQHQQHQAHQLRLNLAGVHGPFSPGVVMSPGTFYGRPGEVVPNPNPWINAAVGAPVHVGEQPSAQSPHHGQGPTPHAYATHGAYFYAMSSPKKAPSGHEPKGYFDPMYFPAGASGYGGYVAAAGGAGGSSGLAKEVDVQAKEDESENAGGDGGGGVKVGGEEGGGGVKGKGNEMDRDEKPSALAHAVSESGADDVFALADASAEAELGGATISRTHSVGYARKPGAGHTASSGQVVSDSPPPSFAKSDPIQGWSRSVANAVASTEIDDVPLRASASIQELKLPARVPWRSAAPFVAAKEKETKKEGEND